MPPDNEEAWQSHFPHHYKTPQVHESVFEAAGSVIAGDVHIGAKSSVWFNSVIRGDVNAIRIGERTNIQDLTMVHVAHEKFPCHIGDEVTVGHSAVIHACKIGNEVMVGMGSVILDGAEIGDLVLVGAGSLVSPGKKFPSGVKILGRPAKIVADLTEGEIQWLKWSSGHYQRLAQAYLEGARHG